MTRSGSVGACEPAIRWMTSSLSEDDWKIEPLASSRSRSSAKLTRLPLCASAMPPRAYSTTSGWQFLSVVEPVVE